MSARGRTDPYAWRRTALALAVAAMGGIDLASALLSHASERLHALVRLVPTTVLDTSRTFTLLAGALLLVAALGLRRGKRRAFVAALFLCAVSVPVNLLKALDLEEATVASALLFALGLSGDAFRVKSRGLTLRALGTGALWVVLAFGVYAVGGSWLVAARYGQSASPAGAALDAAYRLFGVGHASFVPEPGLTRAAHRVVRWFQGSLPVLGTTLVVGFALALLRPVAHRGRQRQSVHKVAALLRRHGDSTVGSFALDPETDYFFSANERAVIAYRFEAGALLVIGDPIGPEEEIEPLLEAFAAHCREFDWPFGFFQARGEHLPAYRRMGWRALPVGEDPILWTERFTLEGSAMGEVRRAVNKLGAAGIEARLYDPETNPFGGRADDARALDELRAVSADWLRGRRGEEKGFCMGRFDPHRLAGSWLVVAWNPARGRAEAFVTWERIWARRGWALDLMRRRSDAVAGVMEFLVAKSVEAARERGDALLSLSLSALASAPPAADERRPAEPDDSPTLGPAAERARELLLRNLSRFYDFEDLFRWKSKFGPEFERRYLVYPSVVALPRVALALARAQSPGGLRSYFRRPAGLAAG
jgi:lysylphosphatidylglycerol synthetase-like protein (DUF2156 family)